MQCKLSDLKPGREAVIAAVTMQGAMRRRLQDLGFLPGTRVCVLLRGWRGGISAYGVSGSVIALRCDDAASVLVEI